MDQGENSMKCVIAGIGLAGIVAFAVAGCASGGGRGEPQVTLVMPREPLYVGSYARIPVRLERGSSFDSLAFRVDGGPAGGTVSESRDETFSLKRPDIVLIAGHLPGRYVLEAVRKADGVVLGREAFSVSVVPPRGRLGPSFVSQAMDASPPAGSAWGGGPAGPQNLGLNSATGTRNVALILVDTNDGNYPTDAVALDAIRDNWRQHISDGVLSGGLDASVRRYYRESSGNRMDVALTLFGPVHLNDAWGNVGPQEGNGDQDWVVHAQACITAADALVDYRQFDTVLLVSQSLGTAGGADSQFGWPIASIGEWGGWVTGDGSLTLGTIQMPFDWTERDGSHRQVFATLSHELGHNLGLGDQYTPGVAGRNVGGWDLMHAEANLPNFSLGHRLRLGWADAAWVRTFDFASLGSPVDQSTTLSPAAAGAPAAGRFAGIEVRVTDGLNYYFEHRNPVAGQIADRGLPAADRVLGTDVRSGSFSPPFARPDLLLLPNDADGDGPVLGNGANYRETDNSSPIYPVEFRADVSGLSGSTADVRIRYGVNDRPDPSIRPWGAPPWQTPDIEVRNARNAVNPALFNVPWQGNPNTIVAKVKNNGLLDAPGVLVNFYVKNFNIGGAPESFLGSSTKDIAAGATVEFDTGWVPPSAGHYCVVVRIPLYQRPGTPVVVELTELNNVAQSNYTQFISPTASPAVRQIAQVEVGNPYAAPTRVYVSLNQTNPGYRTYLEHKWLDLGPGEVRSVTVMFEFVGELPETLREDKQARALLGSPNEVGIQAVISDPTDVNHHVLHRLGGADVRVTTGRAAKFEAFQVEGRVASGTVVTADGEPVPGGHVIFSASRGRGRDARITNQTAELKGHVFRVPLHLQGETVRAYYLPPEGFGDATSETVDLR
jgi:M6 family metalloprotease-like protein